MQFIKTFYFQFVNSFKQSLSPGKLALSITLSLLVTSFPFYGLATLLITSLAIRYKLNLILMLGLSYLIEPLKVFVVIPYIKTGAFISETEASFTSILSIKTIISTHSFMSIISKLGTDLILATMGWFIIATPLGFILYFTLKKLICFSRNCSSITFKSTKHLSELH